MTSNQERNNHGMSQPASAHLPPGERVRKRERLLKDKTMRAAIGVAALFTALFWTATVTSAAAAGFRGILEPKEPNDGDLIKYQIQDLASQAYQDLYDVEVVDTPRQEKDESKTVAAPDMTPGGATVPNRAAHSLNTQ